MDIQALRAGATQALRLGRDMPEGPDRDLLLKMAAELDA